jgi:hypothetical protein
MAIEWSKQADVMIKLSREGASFADPAQRIERLPSGAVIVWTRTPAGGWIGVATETPVRA